MQVLYDYIILLAINNQQEGVHWIALKYFNAIEFRFCIYNRITFDHSIVIETHSNEFDYWKEIWSHCFQYPA